MSNRKGIILNWIGMSGFVVIICVLGMVGIFK